MLLRWRDAYRCGCDRQERTFEDLAIHGEMHDAGAVKAGPKFDAVDLAEEDTSGVLITGLVPAGGDGVQPGPDGADRVCWS